MKWISALSIAALAIFCNACEKHSVSELPPEETPGEHHAEGHASEAHVTAEPHVAEHGPQAVKEPEKYDGGKPAAAHAESKADEAPKFFPEKK